MGQFTPNISALCRPFIGDIHIWLILLVCAQSMMGEIKISSINILPFVAKIQIFKRDFERRLKTLLLIC